MKTVAMIAALLAGACLTAGPVWADPVDDAMDLLQRDPAAGYAALQTLAGQGEVEAMNAVAAVLDDPPGESGIVADPERATKFWEQAIAGGSHAARLNYGVRLLLNDDLEDDARAVAMLREVDTPELAPLAAYGLGRAYLFGQGVERDLEQGSRLMEIAVEAAPDNMDARFLMGRAYLNGWGVPIDSARAFDHLKAAADAGDERAQWNVGMMLLHGDGTAANATLARRYVAASAESGYPGGMVSMAVMLALGEGGPVDAPKAREWYRRAAATGSAHGLRGLAGMLMTGEGGPVDEVAGVAYLDLAAKAGDAHAVAMQRVFADRIAAQNRGAVEAAKSRWLGEHGMPRQAD